MAGLLNINISSTAIHKGLRALTDEYKSFDKAGIKEYLNSQIDKYYKVNTFIHRSEKVEFNKIYYPLKATCDRVVTDFSDPLNFFNRYRCVGIIGSAGSGKSTLIKYIYLNLLQNAYKIPLLIELRYLNATEYDIGEIICDKLLKRKIKPNKDILERALRQGAFTIIMDGYDEIYSDQKMQIENSLNEFIDSYPENNYIITSRPNSGLENFLRFDNFYMNPLSYEDVTGFIEKIQPDADRRKEIIKTINSIENNNIRSYLENPLLLSMFILTHETYPDVPLKKSNFYRNVFEALYSQHDGISKSSFKRERLSGLEKDDFEKILEYFSFISYFENEFEFDYNYLSDTLKKIKTNYGYNFDIGDFIKDLTVSLSIIIIDGAEYSFPHRSMQEFFCSMFIKNLPDENKKNFYSKLIEGKYSYGNNDLLFQLCDETDSDSYYRYYLKPVISFILTKLDSSLTDHVRYRNFFELYRPGVVTEVMSSDILISYYGRSFIQKLPKPFTDELYYMLGNIFNDFENKFSIEMFFEETNIHAIQERLEELFEEMDIDTLEPLLKRIGFDRVLDRFVGFLKEEAKQRETQIERQNFIYQDLLSNFI